MARHLAVGCVLAGVLAGCGDTDEPTADLSTTVAPDEAWFTLAPVMTVSAPPCASDATPSSDTSSCLSLGEQLIGPNDIVAAEAIEHETLNCSESELVCFETGSIDETTESPQTVWAVRLTLSDEGLGALNTAATQCYDRTPDCPSGQIAIVLDDLVLSAPEIHEPTYVSPYIQLADDLTEAEARDLTSRFD